MTADVPPEAYIRVVFRMLRTDEGGRRKPVFSSYRPDFQIGRVGPAGQTELNGAECHFDVETVWPGDVVAARLRPGRPEFWTAVAVGDSIGIYEGPKQVGVAEIVEILPH